MNAVQPLRGFCCYYFETSEGAYCSFQDERFTGVRADHVLQCTHCDLVWDRKNNPDAPRCIDLADLDECAVKFLADTVKRQHECSGHEWVLHYPDGVWSYEGLNILNNGDTLTIFDKFNASRVVWSGKIRLHPRYIGGAHLRMGAHCYQAEVQPILWEGWFHGNYPAELTFGARTLQQQSQLNKKDKALRDQERD